MPRPGFVLEVDERTPPLLVNQGEGFRMQKFPLGTRVIYPPDPLPGVQDVNAEIRHALLHPLGDSEPLPELLRPGMKLTIAIDDISIPLPPMRTPDIRQRILEHVIEMAARAGVDDVELIVATALHRRMTAREIRRMVGERVFRSFWPSRLYNFDAEDRDALADFGKTEHGEEVEISKRAAESDLIVYVNINLVAMDGGHKSVAVGLASYRSLRHHHNVHTMLHSTSYMDPREGRSAINDSTVRMGRKLADDGVKVFQIETTLNSDTFPSNMGFLNKREWEWSMADQGLMMAAKKANDMAPPRVRRDFFRRIEAPYKVTSVNAGEVEAVHERTLENLHRQQLVEVRGQSDIAIFGIPYLGPYNVNSILNPILVHCLGLGYLFNMYRNQPIVRQGGVAILYHPVPWEFHQIHHPSYIDFFEEVLAETTDPKTIETKFEERYASDPWYVHLYRTSHAYHGVHPFYMWYWGAHGRDHVGDVIFVGGEPKSVARLGYRRADSLRDAMEMAKDTVGSSPSITYFHAPPIMIADVV
jgi:lactate racemase